MGQLTARCSENADGAETARWTVLYLAERSLTGFDGADHSTPEGAEIGLANGKPLGNADSAVDGVLDGAADGCAFGAS